MDLPGREVPGDVNAVRDADLPVSCDPLMLEETRRAVNQLKSWKVSGGCGIYAELLRAGRATAVLWLHTLLCTIWKKAIIPNDWRGRCRSDLGGKW